MVVFLVAMMLAGVPAFAQMDFAGSWGPLTGMEDAPERVGGPDIGDYTGIPISDAARMRADNWSATVQNMQEWQCRPHSADYIWRGPSGLQITQDIDPVTRTLRSFKYEFLRSVQTTVWMDGRPHPPANAEHTWGGFATGEWIGNMLKVTVTHLKEGYLRRNGLPRSDLATVEQYWIRNGDYLSVLVVMHDPVYLTEPFVRSSEYRFNATNRVGPYPCGVTEERTAPKGSVPHWLPGTNPDLEDYANQYEMSQEGARGGAATMYPEFRSRALPPRQ
jgi:hypothetical protein